MPSNGCSMDVTHCRVLKLYYAGYAEVIEAVGASKKSFMSFTRRNDKALDALLLECGQTSLMAPSLETPTNYIQSINV